MEDIRATTLATNSISTFIVIEAPMEEVWRALTTPRIIKQWFFGVETESDWKEGGPIVHHGEYQGRAYEDKGEILKMEPLVRLVHTHWSPFSGTPDSPENYQTVTYELPRMETVARLTVSETNLPSVEAAGVSEGRWDAVLKDLKFLLEQE
jgi:uncharacterized protein YndB with AHSA1/START domain